MHLRRIFYREMSLYLGGSRGGTETLATGPFRIVEPRYGPNLVVAAFSNWACMRRSSSSIRHMPLTKLPKSKAPWPVGSHSFLVKFFFLEIWFTKRQGGFFLITYQISISLDESKLDFFQISLTMAPSSFSLFPTVSSTFGFSLSSCCSPFVAGIPSSPVIKSTDRPLQPAARLFLDTSGGLNIFPFSLASCILFL